LGLSFKVGDAYVQKQTITVGEKPTKPDIDKLAREEQGRLSDYDSKIPENKEFSHDPAKREMEMAQLWMNMPKKREDYKEECRGYIKAYKYYLNKKYNYELGQARYRTVQFVVENTGKTPGQEIVLVVHFPGGFYFYDDDNDAENQLVYDFHIQPEKPTPPKVTESLTEKMQKLSSLSDIMYSPSVGRDTGPQHVRGPFITRIKSTGISYEIDEILHNFKWEREISFLVIDEAIGKTREITYEIHAANLPVPISGSLWIEVVEE
jgi:hypothetical protein